MNKIEASGIASYLTHEALLQAFFLEGICCRRGMERGREQSWCKLNQDFGWAYSRKGDLALCARMLAAGNWFCSEEDCLYSSKWPTQRSFENKLETWYGTLQNWCKIQVSADFRECTVKGKRKKELIVNIYRKIKLWQVTWSSVTLLSRKTGNVIICQNKSFKIW